MLDRLLCMASKMNPQALQPLVISPLVHCCNVVEMVLPLSLGTSFFPLKVSDIVRGLAAMVQYHTIYANEIVTQNSSNMIKEREKREHKK